MPELENFVAFPTTIFLDKNHNVRMVHTGFNGPATGEKYVAFKKEFESFVGELLAE